MDKKLAIGVGVGASVLAIVGALFLTMPGGGDGALAGKEPEAAAEAGAQANPKLPPGAKVLPKQMGKLDLKLEIPEGAKVEDGGLAFGKAVCENLKDCACEKRPLEACARGWSFVDSSSYAQASCLLEISCEDYCAMKDNTGEGGECGKAVDALVAGRFSQPR